MPYLQDNGPTTSVPARALLRLLVVPTFALALVACSSTPAPPDQTASGRPRTVAVDAPLLVEAMLSPADETTASLVIASLPQPLSTETREVPNLHAHGVVDRVESMSFGGVIVEVYRPGVDAPQLLSGVTLVASGITVDGLVVGMDVGELYRRLGRPAHATEQQVVFRVVPSATTPYELSASLDGDTVTSIRWSAYLD